MSRISVLAATTALVLGVSPIAFASDAVNTAARPTIVATQDSAGDGLSSITIHSSGRFQDYTGMAPSMIAMGGPLWSADLAHDYDGTAPAPSAALLAAVPNWSLAMAHDYTGE